METGIATFDPNDLISYSPEESEDEGEPPSASRPPTEQTLLSPVKPEVNQIDLAAISGEEIQITVPSVSASVIQERSPPQGARFKCKFCPAYTHTAEDFIKHFIMHFGRNRISYKEMTHEEVRALPNAKEKFVCGICARCFETRDAVKDHMIKDHGFNEIKPREKSEKVASTVPTVPSVKRKLDDEFVDSQKLPLSDSSSCSSVQKESVNKPPSKSASPVVPQSIISVASTATVVLPTPSSSVICKSDKPSTSSMQPLQQSGQAQMATITHIQKVNEAEDAELNEFLQPMSLKTLKLKLLAGLKLKCPQKGCVYKFETRAKRDVHLKCHNIEPAHIGPGGPGPVGGAAGKEEKKDNFKCYQCGIEFPRWRECSQHLWKQHQVDVNMLKCPVCDVRFDFAVKVYRHLQTHRPVKAFSCPSCSKSFATQSHLSVHEMLHKKQRAKQKTGPGIEEAKNENATNAENEADAEDEDEDASNREGKPTEKLPWYAERKCDICGHMFSTSKILSKHIKTVHHKIKPFICSVCGYKSARKVTLTIHMRQHSGQKPLECKECTFRTADPSALKYHEKRHSKDKWYECKFCGLLTIQASALKTHIRSNHPKEYESMKCDLCNFSSVNPELLARHKSDHKAGLIKSEDSRDSVSSKRSKNAPESSSDCFLPIESTDSVVHDAGGFTIPAVINAPVAHSEETQFPT
ncbi:zinc finger protein 426 [Toxorhynchites rutilus septentrionalis]|uniref:zinc finger protein 426 n=1 Tax=Toxorhynchites rutilus septentrionalis TaxID=329112 RepID=UPI002478F51D|nr:zinc finger protein 426 [Toxorhynchites rutilus septentrionalis]